ncbi:MAG: glycosyltransferase [Betaproteobacteria bacterium HGW-Betaproteobacteria-12]|nr:MAG: glycosyltransferase [Betaproteobacteria bacterium HGW-Betaproteobacteria-12]
MAEILVLSKGEDSPSTRYRALQFFDRLRAAGHQPYHLSLSGGAGNVLRALRAARRADLVLVLRKTLPGPLLWLLRRASRRLVFDLDDAIFCKPDGSPSATRLSRFAAMVRCCDQVTAGNGFLAAMAARFNPAVTIIPTCVDVARYAPGDGRRSDHFDVVWIGSSSTRKYLEAAIPALREASRRIPALRLKIIADFDLDAPGFPTLPVRWRAESEAAELASAQVGIAPMHDDDWSRGKCALKVLQYMAAGLPVVSSPVGVNGEAVLDGETGYLARSDDEWVAALQALAADPERGRRMGLAGSQRVAALYSSAVVGARLLALLEAVVGGSERPVGT